jgi:Tfp pilus assembly PilM family ATPase
LGVEFDSQAIRAARLSSDGRGGFAVAGLEEFRGDLSKDSAIIEGLRQVAANLGGGVREPVVSCLTGKQVFATQLPFRKLGTEEMEQALRLELRKVVHFEVATSALDYEMLPDDNGSDGGSCQLIVALAANSVLSRQMGLLEKSGFKVSTVDVLPIAIANSIWAWRDGQESDAPSVALHIGPQVSTIVIDCEYSPFFNRSIYFAAEEVAGNQLSEADKAKRMQSLVDEAARSLSFYDKNASASGFQEILLLGDYLDIPGLAEGLRRQTGLQITRMDLAGKLGGVKPPEAGRFDLAVALALRGDI